MALKPYRSTAHWKKLRLQVLRRDAYTCSYCGDVADQVDHVVPKVKGGEDTLENCVACCRSCNLRKADKEADKAFFLGLQSTPPDSPVSISPKRTFQSKPVKNGHTTVRIDANCPFTLPSHAGAS